MMLQRRTICTLWAFTVYFGCFAGVHADEPRYLRGTELTSQFQIEASSLRKSTRDGEFTFDLVVTNQSNQDHQGPLALVLEKTGIEGLLPKNFDHQFADDGQGFLELVANNRTLKAGQTLKLRRVRLKSAQELEGNPADQFSPVARIYALRTAAQAVAGQPVSPQQAGVPRRSLPGGIPLRLPARTGGQGTGDPDEGVKPVPDPIGDTGEQEQVAEAGEEPSEGQPAPPRDTTDRRLPTEQELESALKAKNAWDDKLFDIEGVHSVGRGWGKEGDAVVRVTVEKFEQKRNVPSKLDGVNVEVYVYPRAKFEGRGGQIGFWIDPNSCPDGDPQQFFTRPIKIGVSGWNTDIALCATGTLGCRLEDPADTSKKFILSNSHVFADGGLDLSGTGRTVQIGDTISQPGPADFSCAIPPAGQVGQLFDWVTFNVSGNNTVDAAIATTTPLLVGTATPCNGYGIPRETTVAPAIGLKVMKYGRTTRLTSGTISVDSMTVSVGYGGGVVITFINQFVVDPDGTRYSAGGDSGSLTVTRAGRMPVGLHFAGNGFQGIENPIDAVLATFGGLRVDGQP